MNVATQNQRSYFWPDLICAILYFLSSVRAVYPAIAYAFSNQNLGPRGLDMVLISALSTVMFSLVSFMILCGLVQGKGWGFLLVLCVNLSWLSLLERVSGSGTNFFNLLPWGFVIYGAVRLAQLWNTSENPFSSAQGITPASIVCGAAFGLWKGYLMFWQAQAASQIRLNLSSSLALTLEAGMLLIVGAGIVFNRKWAYLFGILANLIYVSSSYLSHTWALSVISVMVIWLLASRLLALRSTALPA